MALAFNRDEVSALLVKVHRRCCICHRYCGVKIETDHIVPSGDGGADDIENAIPVCFECHAEIHSYNPQHPRGRKFLPDELRGHKAQWLETCRERPELLIAATRTADVGPLQALIDELEFNKAVAKYANIEIGALFADEQFRRAVAHGAVSTLEPAFKKVILDAYAAMSASNQRMRATISQSVRDPGWDVGRDDARWALNQAIPRIDAAHESLLTFLASDGD